MLKLTAGVSGEQFTTEIMGEKGETRATMPGCWLILSRDFVSREKSHIFLPAGGCVIPFLKFRSVADQSENTPIPRAYPTELAGTTPLRNQTSGAVRDCLARNGVWCREDDSNLHGVATANN